MSNRPEGLTAGKDRQQFMPKLKPEWKWSGHISGKRCSTMYRDNKLGVQAEKWCKRREGDGPAGYEFMEAERRFLLMEIKRNTHPRKK